MDRVLNQEDPEEEFIFEREEYMPVLDGVYQEEITKEEVRNALKKLKNDKVPGLDGIQAKTLKNAD